MKVKEWFKDFARGSALGTGILPGVSVGTISIIVDAYNKLINSIDGLRKNFLKSFLALLPIALGCVISAVALLIFWKKVAYIYFPFIIIALLAGVVIGGLPLILKELNGVKWGAFDIVRLVIGFLLASSIGLFSLLSAAGIIKINLDFIAAFNDPFNNWWIYFIVLLAGFIAAIACLIPGISGSMILFIFSLYNPIVGLFISDPITGQQSIFHNHSNLFAKILIIIVLLIGVVVGLLAISKLMRVLLDKYRVKTFEIVFGFIVGSLISMFLNNDMYNVYISPTTNQWWQFLIGGVALIIACIGTYLLIKKTYLKNGDNNTCIGSGN